MPPAIQCAGRIDYILAHGSRFELREEQKRAFLACPPQCFCRQAHSTHCVTITAGFHSLHLAGLSRRFSPLIPLFNSNMKQYVNVNAADIYIDDSNATGVEISTRARIAHTHQTFSPRRAETMRLTAETTTVDTTPPHRSANTTCAASTASTLPPISRSVRFQEKAAAAPTPAIPTRTSHMSNRRILAVPFHLARVRDRGH